MTATVVAILVASGTFVAAMVGIALRDRLPAHHLDGDSKDAVKLVTGLIATITALVLGLLISAAHSAYDAQSAELQQLGVNVYEIDRALAKLGPEAQPLRERWRRIVAADIERIWSGSGTARIDRTPIAAQKEAAGLFDSIASLPPGTEVQRLAQGRALQLFTTAGETRRLLAEQAIGRIAWPLVFVLVAWLILLFFSFGLFARFNATVVTAFLIGAVSVAGALFLILEMNQPYSGWMQLSSAPLRAALAQIGQ
jgi:Protein of unknown function (DUF4239)